MEGSKTSRFGALLLCLFLAEFSRGADQNWPIYLGDHSNTHYSPLKQINRRNVARLEVAWVYHCGDAQADRTQIQCNPLVVDGTIYATSPRLKALALDAATGCELWRFDPFAGQSEAVGGVNRGVVHWADGDDRRILYIAGNVLHALDAKTGKLIPSFGEGGRVDMKKGLDRDVSQLHVTATTPGIVFRDLIILCSTVGEGPGPAAPGHVCAYNIRTGRRAWIFHTIPHPGEDGYETWPPDAWQFIGGANCWPGMALDEARGIVYVPLGSATWDFWGGNRVGQDLYANCLVALDAATGKRLWHYQLVHHDLWDRDPPAPPNLVTVRHQGKMVDAVAQVTKAGVVFVFDRVTGEPLFPIEERPVPASDLQGESTWPTQPFPTKPAPFTRQVFSANEITDISPEAHKAVLDRFVKLRPHTPFLPPSREGTIIFPGYDGGAEWGGAAVDPRKGILYVNANEMAWVLIMTEKGQMDSGASASSGERIYNQVCAACHNANRLGNPAGAVPSLAEIGKRLKRPDILQLMAAGRGRMPGFGFLSAAQKEAVAGFLLGEPPSGGDTRGAGDAAANLILSEPYRFNGYERWFDPKGYPAVKPPWGTLSAINLNTGEYVWRTTLGELPELTAKGIPPTGTENYGGPALTAGGLIFIAASKDERLHVFDRDTGKLLWQTNLPAGGYATPATYEVKGRQYVVMACGGGKMGTKSGDAYLAFALPK
jgi:quinoprotein glucose dehydrogenase